EQVHQLVLAQATLSVTELDWRGLDAEERAGRLASLRATDKASGFDFATAPLMRIHLVRLEEERYHFLWSHHHVLLDGWCGPILFGEVLSCYRGQIEGRAPRLAPVVPYEQYIGWLYRRDKRQAQAYWRAELAGLEGATPLPADRLAPAAVADRMRQVTRVLPRATSEALEALVRRTQVTMNVAVQAAWSYLLHRHSGQASVVFGTTVSGRPAELAGVERMLGLFI